MTKFALMVCLSAALCFLPPVLAEDGHACSHDPVMVHGQKLYRSCHCESLEYPDLQKEAAKLKAVKCENCRDLGKDWKKCLDCDGMQDFLRSTCENGTGFSKDKACSALKQAG